MITGRFDQQGRPLITIWVQIVKSPLEKVGQKMSVDFMVATGSKRTVLGAADAARLGVTQADTRPKDDQSPTYWQLIGQPLRTLQAELNFQDDWKTPDRTFEIDMLDFTQPGADMTLPSYIGMDIMENWEIIMEPSKNLLKLIPSCGAMTPPEATPSHDGEPHTIDQAFTIMTDRTMTGGLLVTSEDFRKVAERHLGLDGIRKYPPGHNAPQVQSTVDGIPVNFHIEAYTSAVGRLQIWMQASMPHHPEKLVATARFSWAATGEGADMVHSRIKDQIGTYNPSPAPAPPPAKTR